MIKTLPEMIRLLHGRKLSNDQKEAAIAVLNQGFPKK